MCIRDRNYSTSLLIYSLMFSIESPTADILFDMDSSMTDILVDIVCSIFDTDFSTVVKTCRAECCI